MVTWQETTEYFSRVTDKIGKKIDIGIFETVVALNMMGITTRQSCEGHLQWGCPHPWVDIHNDDEQLYRLYHYISLFYKKRPIVLDTVLVFRGCRIQSYGAAFFDLFTEAEREEKLRIYQAEMAAFTEFLKSLLNDDQEIGTFTLSEIPTKIEAPEA